MRAFIIDNFNTWYDWRLTLTGKSIGEAEPKTNYLALEGASGSLDLTEALTGDVQYTDRTLTASFWTSEGTHEDRMRLVKDIRARLHGKRVRIVEPDDPNHYYMGRVTVKAPSYSAVHIEFSIEATCDPWLYSVEEIERRVDVAGEVSVVLRNEGRKTVCPELMVTGVVRLTFGGATTEMTDGSYVSPDLLLKQGVNVVQLSGRGSITFTYREASI